MKEIITALNITWQLILHNMKEEEIIRLWKSGIDKHKLTELYKRSYNNNVKLIRANMRHRHDGRFITTREALYVVERVIYKNIMKRKWVDGKVRLFCIRQR